MISLCIIIYIYNNMDIQYKNGYNNLNVSNYFFDTIEICEIKQINK